MSRRLIFHPFRVQPLISHLAFLAALCIVTGGQDVVAQTPSSPPGIDAPDEGRWVEVEVPVEELNRARRAAGQDVLRPKGGRQTVTMRYQQPVEREWSFGDEIRASTNPWLSAPTASAAPPKASDGSRVIEGINFDDDGTLNGGFVHIPADPHGAVGSNHICHVVNTSIECHDKGSGISVLQQSLDDFFTHDSGNDLFDPRVVYDPRANRWVVLVLNKVDTGTASNNTSEIFLAASDGSDPAGTWDRQTVDVKKTFNNNNTNNTSTECWFDYPSVSLDEEAIYVTGSYFAFESESESGLCDTQLGIFDQGIYSGSASTLAYLQDPNDGYSGGDFDGTLQPAFIYGSTPGGSVGTWVVQYSGLSQVGGPDEFWLVTRVDNPLGSTSSESHLVTWGDVDDTGSGMPDAPQPDTTARIETNDRRALDLVWRDDRLWGTTTVVPPSGHADAGQATAHYGQIDVSTLGNPLPSSNAYVGGQDVESGAYTYFPSVAVDAQGNTAFAFSLSGPSTYAGSYLVTRPAGGSLSNTYLARDGVDRYVRTFGGSQNRWGDYSAVEIDPSDGSVWAINKVALSEATSCSSDCGRWGVFLTKFSSSVLPVELVDFSATVDGQTAVLRWTTASETDNAGFRVEHRGQQTGAWSEAAFVEGHGSTAGRRQYRHEVVGLQAGRHQFRLVQVDHNGSTSVKGPVDVVVRPEGRFALQAPHPNPAAGEATMRLAVQRKQEVNVSLYNALGQKVRTLHRTVVQPTTPVSLRIRARGLSNGLYVVRVEGQTFVATRKLMIAQ